ncbi:MAG: hypothetical protein J2P17_10315 [Mycobacterium sp.]|nr:hypothetical protein [Mycobacterium sp.]
MFDKIRILMGTDMSMASRAALLAAAKSRVEAELDASLEAEKHVDPWLSSVPAIVDALRRGQIECRVYNKEKFHAKAYIAHAKSELSAHAHSSDPPTSPSLA